MPKINFETPGNKKRIETILELMKDGPVLASEMTAYFDTHIDVIRCYFRHLIKLKKVYVSNYIVESNGLSKLYSLGNQKSVNRASVVKNHSPIREFNEKVAKVLNTKKAKAPKNFKPKPDIAAEWMFNPC
jgi:hypothetical protein